MFRSIRWRIAVFYIALILLVMVGLVITLSDLWRGTYLADLQAQLTTEATMVADALALPVVGSDSGAELAELTSHYAALLDARVTIIDRDGTVLSDSHEDIARMGNHLFRPEVQQAINQGEGSAIRFSRTLGYSMMYGAVPITANGETVAIARVALPLGSIEANLAQLRRAILAATLLAALLAMLLAWIIAECTARPIRQLTGVVEQMAKGDLSVRHLTVTRDEVGQLSNAFNRMVEELQEKIVYLTREQARLAGILSNMVDGVLITGPDGRVLLINEAAARLLNTNEENVRGNSFAQVARHHEFVETFRRCLETGEEQIQTVEARNLFLRAVITPLKEANLLGYLVILQDLTQIRRLETIRRDFISNISHELRTPLASLKALADTLRDGALDDPPAARRFLTRIDVEVDTMAQIVEELLELARIESGQVPIQAEPVNISDIISQPVERLRLQANRAGIELNIELPPADFAVLADVKRIHQVIGNLVHNAIKYTPSGGKITITAEVKQQEVIFSVSDTGVGIPSDDLPRIFERFYKADRARSSQGTGLGLAIAKHIVLAHGGRIWVESVEGRGSTFSFSLRVSPR